MNVMKKKILILMPSMFIGGAERSLIGLLDAFDYSKVDIDLFLYRHEGEFLSQIPEQVHVLPLNKSYSTFDVPIAKLLCSNQILFGISRIISKIALKVHCMLSKENPGVWMHMQYTSKYLQWLLPKISGSYDMAINFLGIPDVLLNKVDARIKLTWNHTDYTTLGPCHSRDLKLYHQLDYVVSVSSQCEEQFLRVYPELKEHSLVIENILPLNLMLNQASKDVLDMSRGVIKLLSIGRFCDAKNFDNVPDICKRIRDTGLDVVWYLIGYGGGESLIREKIKESGMENYVIVLGKKENPYPYINACDLYVQPSRYEGKCVTVREAQVLGKPVVITNYATAPSQLENGVDGIVVPMDNEKCAEEIVSLLNNPARMDELVHSCKKHDYSNAQEARNLYQLMED